MAHCCFSVTGGTLQAFKGDAGLEHEPVLPSWVVFFQGSKPNPHLGKHTCHLPIGTPESCLRRAGAPKELAFVQLLSETLCS